MTSKLRLMLGFISLLTFAGCYDYIQPGYVGIQVVSCGSNQGVSILPAGVGYQTTTRCTTYIEYPVFVQNVIWTKNPAEGNPVNEEITFTNADKMSIAADISLAYQLDASKAAEFYQKFHAVQMKEFTDGFMHNMAREKFDEAAGRYKIDDIMGDNAKFLADVRASLQKEMDPYGIHILQFGFVGAPRPPQAVIDSITATTHAAQEALKIQNELAQSTAQGKKKIAEAQAEAEATRIRAEAQAKANQIIAASLTPSLIENKKVEKWDGKLSEVITGNGGGLIMNLK